ncbi:MAG: monovalent cation:proton antiporter-2 (CPA2) family protein [gamma proteobacterium symbiont of Taylorina sp.]|nr:monovalent cation:proton antiporter-2 (CPA2) family protein [gamma proteobacterium symbiont of Taylorina sp.]
MNEHSLLVNILIYLLSAVIAVPIFKKMGLGSVLGYLAAGTIIGPWGLSLITNIDDILHFSEFGVVLLFFLIGLELEPKRLLEMRHSIIGMGSVQIILTSFFLFIICLWYGLNWSSALIVAMSLSLSSTAITLQILKEKNLLKTDTGHSAFSVLLFQDIAVIPIMAAFPLIGGSQIGESHSLVSAAAEIIAVILLVVIGGHYLTKPIFQIIARTHMRELFIAFTLLLIIAIALLMEKIGLSMALGSFLAGVLLAKSEFRHELEVEIDPFKGLLMGLFFMAIGMSINLSLLIEQPFLIFSLVTILIMVKLGVLFIVARIFSFPKSQYTFFAIILSQGGEFAFVLFALAGNLDILSKQLIELLIVVVALTMAITPLLIWFNEFFIAPRFAQLSSRTESVKLQDIGHPVIIAGFGRFGRVVGRLLHANKIPTTILDHDPDKIDDARKYGYQVYYGDARKSALLNSAGADSAKIMIICVDDPQMVLDIVDMAKKHFPHLTILSRAYDMGHAFELLDRDIKLFQREMLSSAMILGEKTLTELGYGAYEAHHATKIFCDHDRNLFQQLYQTDALEKRISISRQARDELEKVLAGDQEEQSRRNYDGWG